MWHPNSWPLFWATVAAAFAAGVLLPFPTSLFAGFMIGLIGGTIDEEL
jgi:hypothetical protein